jgi:hypothetical protein
MSKGAEWDEVQRRFADVSGRMTLASKPDLDLRVEWESTSSQLFEMFTEDLEQVQDRKVFPAFNSYSTITNGRAS